MGRELQRGAGRRGMARPGRAWNQGAARRGEARHGTACKGRARQGTKARLARVRHGSARNRGGRGEARNHGTDDTTATRRWSLHRDRRRPPRSEVDAADVTRRRARSATNARMYRASAIPPPSALRARRPSCREDAAPRVPGRCRLSAAPARTPLVPDRAPFRARRPRPAAGVASGAPAVTGMALAPPRRMPAAGLPLPREGRIGERTWRSSWSPPTTGATTWTRPCRSRHGPARSPASARRWTTPPPEPASARTARRRGTARRAAATSTGPPDLRTRSSSAAGATARRDRGATSRPWAGAWTDASGRGRWPGSTGPRRGGRER